jgi:hypothetical protein
MWHGPHSRAVIGGVFGCLRQGGSLGIATSPPGLTPPRGTAPSSVGSIDTVHPNLYVAELGAPLPDEEFTREKLRRAWESPAAKKLGTIEIQGTH